MVLAANEIPVEVEGDTNVLTEPRMKQWLEWLRLLAQLEEPAVAEGLVMPVLSAAWSGVAILTTLKIARLASKNGRGVLELAMMKGEERVALKENDLAEQEWVELETWWQKLETWRAKMGSQEVARTVREVYEASGWAAWARQQPDYIFLLTCFYTFYQQVVDLEKSRADFNLKKLLEVIAVMRQHNLKVGVQDLNVREGAVHLSTVHKAKGGAWRRVLICGVVDKLWSNEREKSNLKLPAGILKFETSGEKTSEEAARLFYVALTRASEAVQVSYPLTVLDDNYTSYKQPAEMVVKMAEDEKRVEVETMVSDEEEARRAMENCLKSEVVSGAQYQEKERAYIKMLLSDFVLSASALNVYLADTEEFVRKFVLRAARLEENESNLAFGRAMHSALQCLYAPVLKGEELAELEKVQAAFGRELKNNRLAKDDEEVRQKQGEEALIVYYEKALEQMGRAKETGGKILYLEKNFGGNNVVTIEGVPIKGKIDRIDGVGEAGGEAVIIDYKTGMPKTDREVSSLGKGASEREAQLPECLQGESKRQLLFYKLLCDGDASFKYRATRGVLDFVAGREGRKAVERVIEFTAEELEEMKKLIKKVDGEIRSLEFLDKFLGHGGVAAR
jgi:DNA helicase-2/ATP-dependent DNA helicase PcrA